MLNTRLPSLLRMHINWKQRMKKMFHANGNQREQE
jgi:hypothetical protein